MSNIEKLYDIQLSLDREESEMLVQILEAFACGIEDTDFWSGGNSEQTISLIDNFVSTITLHTEEHEIEDVVSFSTNNGWWYCKGG